MPSHLLISPFALHSQYTKVKKLKKSTSAQSDLDRQIPASPISYTSDNDSELLHIPPELASFQTGESVPSCLQQAREILRLARVVKAEVEEMKREVQGELELARKERCDAELLKRNAAEILRMSKEKLKIATGAARH